MRTENGNVNRKQEWKNQWKMPGECNYYIICRPYFTLNCSFKALLNPSTPYSSKQSKHTNKAVT